MKFLQSAQDSFRAETTDVEPAKLEARMMELKQDIEIRMELLLKKIKSQEEKYADVSEMPQGIVNQEFALSSRGFIKTFFKHNTSSKIFLSDLTEQLEMLKSMQDSVAKELEETSEGLNEAKEAKVTFQTTLEDVQVWLKKAEDQLEEDIKDLDDGQEKHKALVAEIKDHAPEIEQLKAQAKEAVQKPSSPEDKNEIMDSLADVTSQWQEVQKMADERSKYLLY